LKRHYRHLDPSKKRQLFWLGIGLSLSLGLAVIFSLYLLLFGIFTLTYIGTLACIIFPMFCFVAIIRHLAFNIRTAIHQSIFWVLLCIVAFLPFYAILRGAAPFLAWGFNHGHIELCIAAIFALGLGMVGFARWSLPHLDQWFFKKQYRLRDEILAITAQLSTLETKEEFTILVSQKTLRINSYTPAPHPFESGQRMAAV
jgi:hypothetical protein